MKKLINTIKSLAGKTIVDPQKARIAKDNRVWLAKNKKFYDEQTAKRQS